MADIQYSRMAYAELDIDAVSERGAKALKLAQPSASTGHD